MLDGIGQAKILVAGSFVMDQIGVTRRLPGDGESILGESFHKAPGGKGANQAVQAARLGARTIMFGKVGNDTNGEEMLRTCNEAGVDTGLVVCEKGAYSGCAMITLLRNDDGSNANRILVLPGTNMTITPDELHPVLERMADVDMVMLQLEIPTEINCIIARRAKDLGIPVMLNPAPYSTIPAELMECVSFISPNEHESEALTGIHISKTADGFDLEAARASAQAIQNLGVKNVLITIGSAGAVLLTTDDFIYSPAVSGVSAVDPTAAGDSFISAFCCAMCSGSGYKEAMRFANATAAITVSNMGAMPSLPKLDAVLSSMNMR